MPLRILPFALLTMGLILIISKNLSAQSPVSLTLGVYQDFTDTYPTLLPKLK